MGGTHPLKRRECQETDFTCVTTLAKTDKATMTSLDDTDFSAAAYKALYRIAEHASTEEALLDFGCALHRVLAELIPAKSLYLCLLTGRPGRRYCFREFSALWNSARIRRAACGFFCRA